MTAFLSTLILLLLHLLNLISRIPGPWLFIVSTEIFLWILCIVVRFCFDVKHDKNISRSTIGKRRIPEQVAKGTFGFRNTDMCSGFFADCMFTLFLGIMHDLASFICSMCVVSPAEFTSNTKRETLPIACPSPAGPRRD